MVDGETVLHTRGEGAVRAIVLGEGIDATAVRDDLLGRGVIARPLGLNVLAFCPPLVIDNEDLDHVVEATAESVAAVASHLRTPVR
jgi:adenosylmethionine-8-amino-7-oxononanoate aminotransferase